MAQQYSLKAGLKLFGRRGGAFNDLIDKAFTLDGEIFTS